MGSIESVLASIRFQDNPMDFFDIETNLSAEGIPSIIHLQNKVMRIELTTEEFLEFAQAILYAGERLRQLKRLA